MTYVFFVLKPQICERVVRCTNNNNFKKMKTQTMTEDYPDLNFLTSVLFIFQFCDFASVPTSCEESTFYTENFQFF